VDPTQTHLLHAITRQQMQKSPYELPLFQNTTSRKDAGSRLDSLTFINLCNPADRTRPWGLLGRNGYERKKEKCFRGLERGRCVWMTASSQFGSRLSRKCGILNISHHYWPRLVVKGYRKHICGPPRPVKGYLYYFICR
jgi:hypothetical protein